MSMFSSTKAFLPQTFRATSRSMPKRVGRTSPLTFWAVLCFAAFCGMTIPIAGFLVPILIGVLAVCVAVLAMSPLAIIWLMLVLVFLVVGQLTFFLGIKSAFWVPYLLLLLILIKVLMEQLRFKDRVETPLGSSTTSVLIILSCLFFCMSALANKTDYTSIFVAAKNYIFPWFLSMLVVFTVQRTDDLRRIWKFMLWVVVLQLPFAMPQRFYFAKHNGASWDAVVGTFGGNFLRGGASGGMAIFLVFGIVLAASLFRRKQIGWKMLVGVVVAGLATVALAEVKIFFILMPLSFVLLFRKSILLHPIRAIGVGMLGALLLGLVLVVYQQTYSEKIRETRTLEGLVGYIFKAESNPYFFNPQTRELSRIGAILMWERYNNANDTRFYIGYGPAASRESQTLGTGVAARKFPFTLTTSTASTMLWDVGLIGYGLMLVTLLAGGITAFRLARHVPPLEAAALDSIGVMLLLNLPLSWYNRDLIDTPATQILFAFWIGYLLLCRKQYFMPVNINREITKRAP
jgi:uncharacterized membrane protein